MPKPRLCLLPDDLNVPSGWNSYLYVIFDVYLCICICVYTYLSMYICVQMFDFDFSMYVYLSFWCWDSLFKLAIVFTCAGTPLDAQTGNGSDFVSLCPSL